MCGWGERRKTCMKGVEKHASRICAMGGVERSLETRCVLRRGGKKPRGKMWGVGV